MGHHRLLFKCICKWWKIVQSQQVQLHFHVDEYMVTCECKRRYYNNWCTLYYTPCVIRIAWLPEIINLTNTKATGTALGQRKTKEHFRLLEGHHKGRPAAPCCMGCWPEARVRCPACGIAENYQAVHSFLSNFFKKSRFRWLSFEKNYVFTRCF